MSAVAKRVDYTDGGYAIWTWCPGCDLVHPFAIEDPSNRINRGVTWSWDGNLESPTFEPSLLCHSTVHICEAEHTFTECADSEACGANGHRIGHVVDGVLVTRFPHGIPDDAGPSVYLHESPHTHDPVWGPCHSFLRAGRWEFLSDSAHHLAGQTVDMVPLPDSLQPNEPEETP